MMLYPLALSLLLPLLAPDDPRVETLVRVDPTSGLQATMTTLLGSESFLASIDASAVPDGIAIAEEALPKLLVVRAGQIGPGLLQIRVTGDRERALELSRGIVEALKEIVPDERKLARERLALAEERHREVVTRIERLEQIVFELRKRAGGLDPRSWLATLSGRLTKLLDERWDLALDIAVDEGLRKHLTQNLESVPEFLSVRGPEVPNPEWRDLQAQLTKARTELSSIGSARAAQEMEARIGTLETKLEETPRTVPGPARDTSNPRHDSLRNQLANTEFQLAQKSARLAAVEPLIDRLREEVLQFQSIADSLGEAEEELLVAKNERMNHAKSVASLRDQELQFARPVLTVISGPTPIPGDR